MTDATDFPAPDPSPDAGPTRPDIYWYRCDGQRVPLCLSCAINRRIRGEEAVSDAVLARGRRCEDCNS